MWADLGSTTRDPVIRLKQSLISFTSVSFKSLWKDMLH